MNRYHEVWNVSLYKNEKEKFSLKKRKCYERMCIIIFKKIPQFPVGEKECLQNSKLREKMDEDEESLLTRKNG